VEAGAILSEVCSARGAVRERLVELVHAHRFEDEGGISELSRAVNAGDADRALACFDRHENLRFVEAAEPAEVLAELGSRVVSGFSGLFSGAPAERVAALDAFRVLGCHLRGKLGVRPLNAWIESELRRAGRIQGPRTFYEGRPVIVTANDYQAELFNGDVGVLAPRDEASAEAPTVVHFRAREPESTRCFSPARLPEHETAYALSVHKAQGSEFSEVALVLPSRPSPILTRELVYTAITRARRSVTLYGSREVLRAAIESRIERASGLRDRLDR
jgi:exodeoxyribonuclease V alpha subunit